MPRPPRKPEIKSPAGHWPQLQAAVEAGADAVYFGLKHFTARSKTGFDLSDLPLAMKTLRARGVRGYVTFNTLIFEHEMAEAARTIEAIAEAGADGIIVQDLAAVLLAREIAPGLAVHGSTQMSITEARGVEMARESGVERVTLARELSLGEIKAIAAETSVDLEIFCHGALCVAYSGQCFSSEAWGGRSANRGQCAQACRLPYEMIVDGCKMPLGDARYLLSPGDLYTLPYVPEMIAAGITALKIEGRYKDADYVALTTRAYRKAVDEAWAGRAPEITPREELQLEQVYSRGLGPYFLSGTDHQAVVRGRAPRHRGVRMGRVARVTEQGVFVETGDPRAVAPLKPGDGVVFDAADWRSPQEPEEGGRVFQAIPHPGRTVELRFANGAIRADRIRAGDLVWRTHDPDIDREAKPYLSAVVPLAKQAVRVRVTAREGRRLISEWSLDQHPEIVARVESAARLPAAENRGVSVELLREQFGRLGNTPYELLEVLLDMQGAPFAPASVLNQMRRAAAEQLQALQSRGKPVQVHDPAAALTRISTPDAAGARLEAPAEIHLLVRTAEQLDEALRLFPSSITLDFLDLHGLRPSVERVKAAGIAARVASPRVLKPGEARILNFLAGLDCPILVRGTGLLHALRKMPHAPLIGDFSLNAANTVAADWLLRQGLERITPTHDLNAAQVAALARHTGAERIEVVAYQHLPVFHTEHCVFARFLSSGTSYKDCGRPCEKHHVELRDPAGRSHAVLADAGCRNTVFGAEAQEASAHLDAWRNAGVRHWRLEFAQETGAQVALVHDAFRAALDGVAATCDLAAALRKIAPNGVTEGSLLVPAGYPQLPIL